MDLYLGVKILFSIFIIVDPIGLIPSFISLTANYDNQRRHKTIVQASLTLVIVLSIFTLWGTQLLEVFHISLPAFRTAGGCILFSIAWEMLQARRTRLKTTPEEEIYTQAQESIGIVPLGIPMLAGPGAITNVMVLSAGASYSIKAMVLGSIVLTGVITYFILKHAARVAKYLGQTGLLVLTRLMGLILAAIAVQFIFDGLKTGLLH